ncbi:DUF87 domain-containing protein [Weissella paramesenteroides]|nr:DUF87 domain-containing protein [Weissella paramesenteroides]
MHSMLNQYYNFLITRFNKWVKSNNNIQSGDRFFTLLDDQVEVDNLYNAFKPDEISDGFEFNSPTLKFSTHALKIEDVKLLIISASSEVTNDFLVTLRNRISAQLGEFKNTAIFFIVTDPLDSILGGAYDVGQKNGPFDINEIKKDINKEVQKSNLQIFEKQIIKDFLKNMDQGVNTTALKDFDTIFSIIEDVKISSNQYSDMHLFEDSQLGSFSYNTDNSDIIKTRINQNKELFSKISKAQEAIDTPDRLGNFLIADNSLINTLSTADEWRNVPFKEVLSASDAFEKNKKVKLELDYDNFANDITDKWIRKSGESATQRRKMNILFSSVGRPQSQISSHTFAFDFYFDNNVQKSGIVETNTYVFSGLGEKRITTDDFKVETSGKKIRIFLNHFDDTKTYGGLITYRHKNIPSLTFKLKFMILPFELNKIKKLKPDFEILVFKQHNGEKSQYGLGISTDNPEKQLGYYSNEILDVTQLADLENRNLENCILNLDNLVLEDDVDPIIPVRIGNDKLPIIFRGMDKPVPAKPIDIEYERLNSEEELIYSDGKILFGSVIRNVMNTYQTYLNLEQEMILKKSVYGKLDVDKYDAIELHIPKEVENAYNRLFEYYQNQKTLPSLAILSDEYILIVNEVLETIKKAFHSLVDEQKISDIELKNIRNIGIVELENGQIDVSPLNPMLLQYQVQLAKTLEKSQVPSKFMLKHLNAENLVPYIKRDGHLLQAHYSSERPGWLNYQEQKKRMLTDMTSKVIQQRLLNYEQQYEFLFGINDQLSLNVAVINIVDERNLFDAIIHFMLNKITPNSDITKMTGVNIYFKDIGITINSLFKQFYEVTSLDHLNDLLVNEYRKNSNIEFEDYEILNMLHEEINIYTEINSDVYYHVTFYQFTQSNNSAQKSIMSLPKNYALDGLVNSLQFTADSDDFFTSGFGVGESGNAGNNELIDFAIQWNSFILAANDDINDYLKNKMLTNNVRRLDHNTIPQFLNNSDWVTILNPDVDLNYFFSSSEENNFFVIHYMDQNTNSQYEAITVTANIEQYKTVLENKLIKNVADINDVDTENIIKSFNVLNGEWLLRLASEGWKSHNTTVIREKLSLISAFKETMGILYAPDILWIPISLEEILRVSTMVGLKQSEGMFSSKNLSQKGVTSDDLLFIGIDKFDGELKLHFVPVEVKVGNNDNKVTDKAIGQLKHTAKILEEYLSDQNDDYFSRMFYRNFFKSILVTNMQKLIGSELIAIPTVFRNSMDKILDELSMGQYTVSFDIQKFYHKGFIFEFTSHITNRSIMIDDSRDITLIKVPEEDAYHFVDGNIGQLTDWIQTDKFDFPKSKLLSNMFNRIPKKTNDIHKIEKSIESVPSVSDSISINEQYFDNNEVQHKNNFENVRLLLGKGTTTNQQFYWEYGHRELANRHLLITGKSGQGKTYFIQTLLHSLSVKNIDAIVVDYTDGFLPNQLEPMLLKSLGSKIDQKIIFKEKLPINPFKLREIDFGGGLKFPEDTQDMVDRVTQVIDFVFNLGPQQKNELAVALKEGYQTFGDRLTFTKLKGRLVDDDTPHDKLIGRISSLLDRDPFSYKDQFSWDSMLSNTGTIHIFQLKGFQPNIQKILIEFMLWDLWGYSQSRGENAKNRPIPIVLDEVQNLNFGSNAPTVKILQEGRKFGWSGIFATQQIDSIKGDGQKAIYNPAESIHFLPPEVQVHNLARSLTSDDKQRAEVESLLKGLKKGEAIDVGPNLLENGKLSNIQFQPISITSFEDRSD